MKLHVKLSALWTALTLGQAAKASSLPVTLASDQEAIKVRGDGNWETVAASQTAQALGATGALGDRLDRLVIIPASVSPGVVALLDLATSINILPGGANSLTELKPIEVDMGGAISKEGAWKITTGANVSVIAIGKFA